MTTIIEISNYVYTVEEVPVICKGFLYTDVESIKSGIHNIKVAEYEFMPTTEVVIQNIRCIA